MRRLSIALLMCLSSGCVYDGKGNMEWSVTWNAGLVAKRTLLETDETHVRDEFTFKPEVSAWLFGPPAPEETDDDGQNP